MYGKILILFDFLSCGRAKISPFITHFNYNSDKTFLFILYASLYVSFKYKSSYDWLFCSL